jgi:hypothetical protein
MGNPVGGVSSIGGLRPVLPVELTEFGIGFEVDVLAHDVRIARLQTCLLVGNCLSPSITS